MALPFSPVRPSMELARLSSPPATAARPFSFSSVRPTTPPFRQIVMSATKLKKEESLFMARASAEQAVTDQAKEMDEVDDDECELVSRLELTLGEGENAVDAYLVKAMKNNNGAAVVLLTDVFGFKNTETRDFSYRLSCFGYNVLVPDLFQGRPWSKDRPKNEFEDWRASHSGERVEKAIKAAADWLSDEMAAADAKKKLGILGFCFGGGRVLEVLAKDDQKQYATAVSFYPTRFDETLAANISVPLLLIAGDKDELCSPDKLQNVANQIKGSQARIYPGRGHGFAHCPTLDDDEDAEDAFVAMKAWFHDRLVSCS